VDDEPDARALVKRLLEDCDATVIVAASASEALDRLRDDRPNVLVSDIGMPGEDGYVLLKRIRALEPEQGGNIPALALTAYARAEDRMNAVMAGFQMHLAKPVEPAELITMIAAWQSNELPSRIKPARKSPNPCQCGPAASAVRNGLVQKCRGAMLVTPPCQTRTHFRSIHHLPHRPRHKHVRRI